LDDGLFAECRRGKLMSDHTREVFWRATPSLHRRLFAIEEVNSFFQKRVCSILSGAG
jgi:hypothetical protein